MRVARQWLELKEQLRHSGMVRTTYDRRSEAHALVKYAERDGYVAEVRGGFVFVAWQSVVEISNVART